MLEIELKEVHSGEEEFVYWVSLGFSSDLEEYDVLHIVCGKSVDQQEKESNMDTIYMERFDQSYGCYGGASMIKICETGILIEFTQAGINTIELPEQVFFKAGSNLNGFSDAVKVLHQMREFPWGKIIKNEE